MTASNTPASTRRRPRICLLLDTVEFAYQNELLLGIHEQCVRADVDVFCLSGGKLSESRVTGHSLYDLVAPTEFDGIIVSTGTIVHDEPEQELTQFLERFGTTPLVSLSTAVAGVASVIVDNQSSMREVTKHLIETHGRRRIGFVGVHSPEGEQRLEGYREALFDHGIAFDPELVVMGEFTWESGEEAVRLLMDERKTGCDAIVGSNDWIAMGAMRALELRGIKVPESVAVTGFDDIEDARFADPPLTSISQPVRELGAEAARVVIGMINKERRATVRPVRTRVKLRHSCGCEVSRSHAMGSLTPGLEGPLSSRMEPKIESWAALMRRHSPRSVSQLEGNWAEELATALDVELEQDQDAFLPKLSEIVARVDEPDSMPEWHDVLQILRATCVARLRQDEQQTARAESLFERAHLLIAGAAERVQGQRRIELQELVRRLNEMSRALRNLREDETVLRMLASHLSRLDIPRYYVARLQRSAAPEQATLLLSHDSTTGKTQTQPVSFPASQWVPAQYRPEQRHTLVVEEVAFGAGARGFCVAEMGPTIGIIYDSVRELLNAGLWNAEVLRRIPRTQ